MKRVFTAIALGAALSLSIAATTPGSTPDPDCRATNDIELTQQMNTINLSSPITGTLHNKSTMQSYDDVMLQVSYYNDGNQMVGSESKTINKTVHPGESRDFSLMSAAPAGATHATYAVVCAEQHKSLWDKVTFWD